MTATTATTATTTTTPTAAARIRQVLRRTAREQDPRGQATLLQRWLVARRHRRHLVEKHRFDARDRSDRYIDGPDPVFQREALTRFVQR